MIETKNSRQYSWEKKMKIVALFGLFHGTFSPFWGKKVALSIALYRPKSFFGLALFISL
jgi:hypothetical protein